MRWNRSSRRIAKRNRVSLLSGRWLICWTLVACLLTSLAPGYAQEPTYHNEAVRGQVVWLAAALKEQFGISTVPEAAEQSLAILTTDGEVLPLVENLRGRAFRKDERLREMQVEIWVRRYDKQPLVQILRIFELKDGQRFEVDYWCDVCAIPMYETGPCACCQDHNRIRKRPVTDAEATIDEAVAEAP